MKLYQQDPFLYRNHFRQQVGGELPGFQGTYVQHGNGLGSFLGSMARKAIPLLRAGIKLAAPHVKRAGKDIARDLSGQVIKKVTERIGRGKRNKSGKSSRRKTKKQKVIKAITSKDIFMQ
jgi:hypothetical protein